MNIKQSVYFFLRGCYFGADELLYRFLTKFPARTAVEDEKKRVVFVVDHPSPRVYKMMKQLHKNGWEIICFYRVKRGVDVEKEVRPYSVRVERYISAYGAYNLCQQYPGAVFHVFCCYVYDVPELLIQKKVGKVIFDNYDGYAGFVVGWDESKGNRKTTAQEKFCMENADGMTCRSFESQYNKWRMGYRFKGKRLLFFDYCSTEKKRYLREHKLNDSPIFFYGGGLPDEENFPNYIHSCFVEAARQISANGGQLWVYHGRLTKAKKNYYEKASVEIPGFRLHDAVPFEEMLKVMSGCDFSIMPTRGSFMDGFRQGGDGGNQYYNYIKYIYAAANKFFDASEVGLPLVGCTPLKIFKMLERAGMAVYCPVEELGDKIPYLKEHYDEYRANIIKNIDRFSIEKNIHRLIAFYEEIAATRPIESDS